MTKIKVNEDVQDWKEVDFSGKYEDYYTTGVVTSDRIFTQDDKVLVIYTNNHSSDPRWCDPDFARIYEDDDDKEYNLIREKYDIKKLLADTIDGYEVDCFTELDGIMEYFGVDAEIYNNNQVNHEFCKIAESYVRDCFYNAIDACDILDDCEFALIDDDYRYFPIDFDADYIYNYEPDAADYAKEIEELIAQIDDDDDDEMTFELKEQIIKSYYKKLYNEGKIHKNIPPNPDEIYKNEWVSWQHFMGIKNEDFKLLTYKYKDCII